MILYQNCQMHNVVELETAEGGGVLLGRFPRKVREVLSPLGKMVSQESAGVEIRFVTGAKFFRVSVGSLPSVLAPYENHNQDVFVFRGGFFHSHHRIEPGRIIHISPMSLNSVDRFSEIRDECHTQKGFSKDVWRIMFGRFPAILYGIDTYGADIRPPRKGEVPAMKWLAYGSSITNGASPTVHLNSYIYNAARTASLDVMNQGLSGACLCEPEVARYFCSRKDWDLITLEIGVNMRGSFTPGNFAERAGNLISSLNRKHPSKKIAVITIYPNSMTKGFNSQSTDAARNESAFNGILREIMKDIDSSNIHLIEGKDILDDFGGLTTDLIHPGDYGHLIMGRNLGAILMDIL